MISAIANSGIEPKGFAATLLNFFKKGIDINIFICYNINTEKEKKKEIAQMEWKPIEQVEVMGMGYTEYINADGTQIKRVWYDGLSETYEIERG